MPAPAITVTESDVRSLPSLQPIWRELWWKTKGASFFQSPEAFEELSRQSASRLRLRVLLIAVAGRPVGLLPLVVKSVPSALGRLRLLTDALDERGFVWGALGTNPSLTLDAGLKHIAQTRHDWDALELQQLDGPGLDGTRTARMLWRNGFNPLIKSEGSRPVVRCEGDWIQYWRSLSDDCRNDYRRSEELLAQHGEVQFARYRPEGILAGDNDPRWDLFNTFERHDRGHWNSDPNTNRHGRPAPGQRGLRAMHLAATELAGVDFNVLTLAGRPIAWAYNYRCDGRVETQRLSAIAPHERMASTVLLGRMLRDGFRLGDEGYSFDAETARDAAPWCNGQAGVSLYRHIAPSAARAQAARFFRWLTQRSAGTPAAPSIFRQDEPARKIAG